MTKFSHYDPKVVLAVGAHADDIDVTSAGSVATWIANGAEVHYLVVTDGSKGSDDKTQTTEQLVQIRQQEQRDAAQSLGVKEVHFLSYEDGMLEVTLPLKKDIVRVIRQVRPDTVITFDPGMLFSSELGMVNHPDHRATGQATLDAVFPLARDHLTFPDLFTEEKLEPHKVAHLLLINFDEQNYFVNITNGLDAKLQALQKHASQFSNPEGVANMLRTRAAEQGQRAGYQYAEGFIRVDCMV